MVKRRTALKGAASIVGGLFSRSNHLACLRDRIPRAVQSIVVVTGFVVLIAAAIVSVWPRGASAASTYCGSGSPTSEIVGSIGGTSIYTLIDAYGDPGCSGTFNRQFYHYSGAASVIDIYFWPTIGTRAWSCGSLSYSHTGGATTNILVDYGPWIGSSACGFQADQWTRYVKSGYNDVYMYTDY